MTTQLFFGVPANKIRPQADVTTEDTTEPTPAPKTQEEWIDITTPIHLASNGYLPMVCDYVAPRTVACVTSDSRILAIDFFEGYVSAKTKIDVSDIVEDEDTGTPKRPAPLGEARIDRDSSKVTTTHESGRTTTITSLPIDDSMKFPSLTYVLPVDVSEYREVHFDPILLLQLSEAMGCNDNIKQKHRVTLLIPPNNGPVPVLQLNVSGTCNIGMLMTCDMKDRQNPHEAWEASLALLGIKPTT